jgi:hypothetical protein
VSLQMVGQQHRLRVLQVRPPRHDRVGVGFGLRDECVDEPEDLARDGP